MGGRQAGAARPSASGGQRSAGRARRGALWQRERVVAADAGLAGLRRRIAIQPPGAWRRRCPHGKPDLPSMRPRPARARHPAGACLGARWRRAWIGLGLLACLTMPASDARAAPPAERLAVVIGEAAYSRLPAEPACSLSAQVIASRLRGLGFAVATRNDATNGEIGAMLIALARQAAAGHPSVVIYFCGHAVEFDGRSFLLPIDAVLGRHSDVLAEGIPAQSLLDIANRGTHVGLTVLDLYMQPQSQPNAPAALPPLAAGRVLSPGHIVMAASESAAAATATPLAQSLSAALTKPPGDLDAISAAIRGDLAGSGVALAVFGKGGGASLTTAAAPAAAPKPPPQPAAASTSPAPPAVSMPEEAQYSVLDRRRVQAALHLLGYYGGAVDGIFGPQTRAAIRRYQHDAGVPQTGTLTPQQAARLLAGLPLTGR